MKISKLRFALVVVLIATFYTLPLLPVWLGHQKIYKAVDTAYKAKWGWS